MFATKHGSIGRLLSVTLAGLFLATLVGCSGEDGNPGPTGPTGGTGGTGGSGPTGPSGTLPLVDANGVSNVKFLTARVNSVTVPADGKPVISFTLTDESGVARRGLPAAQARVVMVRLYPSVNGRSSDWRAYTKTIATAGSTAIPPIPAAATQPQATAEAMSAAGGVFTDLGNGSYTYKMNTNITTADPCVDPKEAAPCAVSGTLPYDATLTHRIGIEFRVYRNAAVTGCAAGDTTCSEDSIYLASNNAVYTWQPSSGATSGIPTRDIGSNTACDACHDQLNFHGGARSDVGYCVTCHNPFTLDPQSANSVDMKVMIHKIHRGEDLLNPAGYTIVGYGGTRYDFGEIVFPQDQRNCQVCHRPGVTDAPQADNWKLVVNKDACGTCHDGDDPADPVDFYVDASGTIQGGHPTATDAECVGCHGPNAQVFEGGKWMTENVHFDPEERVAQQYKFEITKVAAVKADGSPGDTACAAATRACRVLPGEFPLLTVKVTKCPAGFSATGTCSTTPTPVLLTDPEFTNSGSTRLTGYVAWTTRNFTSPGLNAAGTANHSSRGQPASIDFKATAAAPTGAPPQAGGAAVLDAANSTYTKASPVPMPASAVGGSAEAFLGGRVYMPVYLRPSAATTTLASIPVKSATGVAFGFNDATAVARRAVIDIRKCNDCHNNIAFHGNNRNSNEELCSACHNPELASSASFDDEITDPVNRTFDAKRMFHLLHGPAGLYWEAGAPSAGYPGKINNCEGCHAPNTYYPVDPAAVFSTSIQFGASQLTPVDDTAITPNASVCSGCHNSSLARTHMEQNGSNFAVTKNANGSTVNAVETCTLCHGNGQTADVKKVHRIGEYRYN